jgi:protein-tyrosine phosphatase
MNIEAKKPHNVLMLAGLGDQESIERMKLITERWKQHGLNVTLYNVGWRDGSINFESKLEEIIKLVDKLAKEGPVSLVGCSAGASAAFNVFFSGWLINLSFRK